MATVEVILKQKIEGLGAEADVVKVKRGFARNFLLPQDRAYEATKANLRHVKHLNELRVKREETEMADAESAAGKPRSCVFPSCFLSVRGQKPSVR